MEADKSFLELEIRRSGVTHGVPLPLGHAKGGAREVRRVTPSVGLLLHLVQVHPPALPGKELPYTSKGGGGMESTIYRSHPSSAGARYSVRGTLVTV